MKAMITCERCGKEMPDNAAICPSCGTASSLSQPGAPTDYGYNPPSSPSSYTSGYGYGQQQMYAPPQPGYSPQPPGYNPQPTYGQPYNTLPPVYSAVSVNVNTSSTTSSTNTAALIVEILLNLFTGIYGVGWLMAGETTLGVVLLICSIVLYWPIMVVGTIFTIGLGLFCLIPLSIGAIILNAIMLNNAIKRKNTVVMVQSVQNFPRQ
jgi:hypothetical protein